MNHIVDSWSDQAEDADGDDPEAGHADRITAPRSPVCRPVWGRVVQVRRFAHIVI